MALDFGKQVQDHVADRFLNRAHHNSVRMEKIIDRPAFPQKFRTRNRLKHPPVILIKDPFQHSARTHGHGALGYHDFASLCEPIDILGYLLDVS